MTLIRRFLLMAITAVMITACAEGERMADNQASAPIVGDVNIYSGRHYDSDLEIYRAFTEETGIRVNIIEAGGDALIERLAREGDASPADLFITADAGILWRAEEKGLFQPIPSEILSGAVPEHFQHPDRLWTGIAKRVRIIVYNEAEGLPAGFDSYDDLADPAYQDMICVRSSSNVYNQSLLASRIARDGEDAAETWARGVVENFARRPQGNDTSQIEAVAAGLCRLAVVNSYYVARYKGSVDAKRAAIGEKIGILYPDQNGRGVHVNISGVGIAKSAPNRENAEALIAYLLRDDVQSRFAAGNNEYPIVETAAVEGPIASLGDFVEDDLPVAALGENQPAAVRIFDRAGWP